MKPNKNTQEFNDQMYELLMETSRKVAAAKARSAAAPTSSFNLPRERMTTAQLDNWRPPAPPQSDGTFVSMIFNDSTPTMANNSTRTATNQFVFEPGSIFDRPLPKEDLLWSNDESFTSMVQETEEALFDESAFLDPFDDLLAEPSPAVAPIPEPSPAVATLIFNQKESGTEGLPALNLIVHNQGVTSGPTLDETSDVTINLNKIQPTEAFEIAVVGLVIVATLAVLGYGIYRCIKWSTNQSPATTTSDSDALVEKISPLADDKSAVQLTTIYESPSTDSSPDWFENFVTDILTYYYTNL